MSFKKLKPCPFCGGKASLRKIGLEWYIHCKNSCIESLRFTSKERLVDWWNNRPSPWHTGTPEKEGWYVFDFDNLDENGENILFLEHLSILQIERLKRANRFKDPKWRKIEPYKAQGEKE